MPNIGTYHDERELEQRAIFAEAAWEFLPAWTVTGGGRAYEYDRKGHIETRGGLFGPGAADLEKDSSGSSFKGNVSYKPSEAVMTYASWSEGFRLGRPTVGLQPGVCDRNADGIVDGTEGSTNVTIASTRDIDSDELENFEVGAKFTLLDRRLMIDADIYRIEWTGLPIRVLAPPPDPPG